VEISGRSYRGNASIWRERERELKERSGFVNLCCDVCFWEGKRLLGEQKGKRKHIREELMNGI
jgi:hypothetical protein